jgi:hypothetical protein
MILFKNYKTLFINKAKIEIEILKKNLKIILFYIFVLVYIASTLGRNIAYYRSQPADRLKDIGFQILPELTPELKIISEVILFINHFIGINIVLSPLLYIPNSNLSTILIGKRVLSVLSIGHVIRFLMYCSTSLPSPATHCLPESNQFDPPNNLLQIFTRFSSFNDLNCGDLIFSGHMFQSISFTIITYLYTFDLYNIIFSTILCVIQIFNSLAQIFFIIASRNHYTIDIITAIYVSLTLWYINLNEYYLNNDYLNNSIKNNVEIDLDIV